MSKSSTRSVREKVGVLGEMRNTILNYFLLSGSATELSSRVTSIQTNIIAESFKNIPTTMIFLFEI